MTCPPYADFARRVDGSHGVRRGSSDHNPALQRGAGGRVAAARPAWTGRPRRPGGTSGRRRSSCAACRSGTSACTAVRQHRQDLAAGRARPTVAPTSTPRSASSTSLIRPSRLARSSRGCDAARSVVPTRTREPGVAGLLLGQPDRRRPPGR